MIPVDPVGGGADECFRHPRAGFSFVLPALAHKGQGSGPDQTHQSAITCFVCLVGKSGSLLGAEKVLTWQTMLLGLLQGSNLADLGSETLDVSLTSQIHSLDRQKRKKKEQL